MRKVLLVIGVLLAGLDFEYRVVGLDGHSLRAVYGNCTGIAFVVYAICIVRVLLGSMDQMPGVFGVKSRLGPVRSGYEFLWWPGLIAAFLRLSWSTNYDPLPEESSRRLEVEYGQFGNEWHGVAVGCAFVVLMLVLKFRAAMTAANERLPESSAD